MKSDETRSRILDRAVRESRLHGGSALSIGNLAASLEMSKSGMFAHFGSKAALEVAVIERSRDEFVRRVLIPAEALPPGTERLTRLFDGWIAWTADSSVPGGCPLLGAAAEYDDRPGRPRDLLRDMFVALEESLIEAARPLVPAARDAAALARQIVGIILGFHHASRLLDDKTAELTARTLFQDLLLRVEDHS